ncbi:MAG: hypothetical protein ACRD6R_10245 [Candidatus Polarisedimenticolia bacterium]
MTRRPAARFALSALAILALVLPGCTTSEVSEQEKNAVLTAADLADWGFEAPDGGAKETWKATRWFDGSRQIEYEYETPDGAGGDFLYLTVTVDLERRPSDSRTTYLAGQAGLGVIKMKKTIERKEVASSCDYGDECVLFLLLNEGNPVGNQFLVRTGLNVYTVQLVGLYFSEAETWHRLMAPRIESVKELPRKPS